MNWFENLFDMLFEKVDARVPNFLRRLICLYLPFLIMWAKWGLRLGAAAGVLLFGSLFLVYVEAIDHVETWFAACSWVVMMACSLSAIMAEMAQDFANEDKLQPDASIQVNGKTYYLRRSLRSVHKMGAMAPSLDAHAYLIETEELTLSLN